MSDESRIDLQLQTAPVPAVAFAVIKDEEVDYVSLLEASARVR